MSIRLEFWGVSEGYDNLLLEVTQEEYNFLMKLQYYKLLNHSELEMRITCQ